MRAIPFKRVAPPETFYLERDEVMGVITSITGDGGQAKRDRALLTFLYNTGARVQEVVDLHCADVDLDKPFRVRLHGKGDKWRACPLWQETAALLRPLVVGRRQDAAVFTTRRQHPLTRFGIYKIVRRRTDQLLPPKQIGGQVRHVSPHILRHATAVSLLEGGAELNVIRAWLGHASLETTHRYAEINMRMKEAAMRLCEPSDQLSSSVTSHTGAVWPDDKMLLDWLRQL